MAAYRFQVGQAVDLAPALSRNIAGGSYIVTRQLPEGPGELQYRIKSTKEPHERVVSESDLRRTFEAQ